jgi:hypothetical protein
MKIGDLIRSRDMWSRVAVCPAWHLAGCCVVKKCVMELDSAANCIADGSFPYPTLIRTALADLEEKPSNRIPRGLSVISFKRPLETTPKAENRLPWSSSRYKSIKTIISSWGPYFAFFQNDWFPGCSAELLRPKHFHVHTMFSQGAKRPHADVSGR